jgi:hypothetical protein
MHQRQRILRIAALSLAGIAAIVTMTAVAGCGSAEAKPVDVTYYYLPG